MAARANIYKENDYLSESDIEFVNQLENAVFELINQMRSSIPIIKGQCKIGYGVSKAKRGIAADSVISITKAIKALKGW